MCGIVAVWDERGVEQEALTRAVAALRHRGPDGQGVWLSPDRRIGLGHARLAIIDPAGSPQPILNESGNVAIVVNGEFYGHDRLRHELQRRGHRFRTGGDSEVALHLYEDHGLAFLDHLRGEFALTLFDARTNTIVAARDRFGIKPLCYLHESNRLLLASEAKALFALGVAARWDADAVSQVCGMQYPLPDQTLFAGVKQLRPGHVLVADDAGVRTSPYWDMDYPRDGDRHPIKLREARERLRAELDEAVTLRLRCDVPLCFHLSGGLDTSSIVALAGHSERVSCFTVSFDEPGYDELEQTQQTALALGAELTPIRVTHQDMTDHFADAVWFSEGLAINGHLPAKYLLAREISRHAKVVLSGEGADEVLAGYAHFKLDLARATGEQPAAGGTMLAGMHLPEGEPLPLENIRSILGDVPAFLEAKATLGRRMHELLSDDYLRHFSGRDPLAAFASSFDVAGQLSGRHPVDRASYLWSRSALANSILRTLGDGTEMAFGVEGRLPFLDHHLFEFARQLPVALKIHDGVEKHVLREAMRGLLPDEVRRRGKHPFTAPPLGEGFMQDTLRGGAVAAVPFFDARKIRAVLDRLPQLPPRERNAWDVALTLAASACLMQQRFGLA
jgi:asparagine synthase (glutamine-hydrolysing)